jgi:hypothetical protein
MFSFTPRPLYLRRKSPRYPLYRSLGGPQSRSGRHGGMKILDPTRLELRSFGRSARSQSLYRLNSKGASFHKASLSLCVRFVKCRAIHAATNSVTRRGLECMELRMASNCTSSSFVKICPSVSSSVTTLMTDMSRS